MDGDVRIKSALAPKVVGYCVQILEEYLNNESNGTLKGFVQYYIKHKTKEPLLKASEMIVFNGEYSLEDAKKYVYVRVFEDTWNGKQWELKVKKELEEKGKQTRFSTTKEDYNYCIDLVGDTFAVQVKPISYAYDKGTNPSLMIDKKRHRQAHLKYQSASGKKVHFAFYNKDNNKITYK